MTTMSSARRRRCGWAAGVHGAVFYALREAREIFLAAMTTSRMRRLRRPCMTPAAEAGTTARSETCRTARAARSPAYWVRAAGRVAVTSRALPGQPGWLTARAAVVPFRAWPGTGAQVVVGAGRDGGEGDGGGVHPGGGGVAREPQGRADERWLAGQSSASGCACRSGQRPQVGVGPATGWQRGAGAGDTTGRSG
jgi:hypothetical protein